MKRNQFTALATAAGMVALTAACGGTSEAPTSADGKSQLTVSLWSYATTPEFKALVDGFQKDNPDIAVKTVDILADDYAEKVTTMLAGGDKTDVIAMKNVIDYSRYATRGQLADVTGAAAKLDKAKHGGLEAYDVDGKYFALPYRQDFWVLYYNKDLVKASDVANLTWSSYAELAKKLTKGAGESKVYGTYQHTWRSVVQAIAAAQTGGDQLSGDYGFMKDQYNLALDLQKSGATMDWGTASTQKMSYRTMFSTGKAALLPMGTWYAAGLVADKEAGKANVNWGIAPLPQVSGDGKVATFGSPTAFAVNKKAANPAAAQRFVEWAASEKGALAIAKIGVTPSFTDDSVKQALLGVKGFPTDEIAKKALSPTTVMLEMPVSDKSSDVDSILNEEHQLIMVGEKSVDAGLAEAGARVKDEVLSR